MRTVFHGLARLARSAPRPPSIRRLFIVHQNKQAIVLRFGDPRKIITEPGLNWRMPGMETVEIFDKRILDLDTAPQEVTVSDQKRLVVDAFTRYQHRRSRSKFYQTVRNESDRAFHARADRRSARCAACSAAPRSRTSCATSARS